MELLLRDVGKQPGALPLLSFTLSELYYAYLESGRSDRALTLEDYETIVALWQAIDGVGLSAADKRTNLARYLDRNPGFSLVAVKLFIMLVFLFFTSPTSSFSLAHAALSSGIKPVLDADLREEADDSDDPGEALR